jgi:hypothetical protein
LRDFARDVEALAKASQQVKGPGDQETVKLQRMSEQLRGIKTNFGTSADEAGRLTSKVKDLGGQFQNLASTVVRSSGIGGSLGSLIGITSVGAAVTAVGVIVGQSLRMAYAFEQASVKAAAALSVGMGAGFTGNISRLQSAAYQGQRYGYNAQTMVDAMTIYGQSSGAAMPSNPAAQAKVFAQVARAYGLEPGQVAGYVGATTALNGQSWQSATNDLFGAVESGGAFGRRNGGADIIGAIDSALATLQYSNPDLNQSVAGPAAFMARMGQLGGYFGTSAGAMATYNTITGAMEGGNSDVRRAGMMYRAGISPLDVIYGETGPNNANSFKLLNYMTTTYGDPNGIRGAANLTGYFGQAGGRTLRALYNANGHSWNINNTPAGMNLSRAEQAMATPSGQILAGVAGIENSMTGNGVKLLDNLVKGWDAFQGMDPTTKAVYETGAAIVAAVLVGKAVNLPVGIGGAARVLGRAAAPAAIAFGLYDEYQHIRTGDSEFQNFGKGNPFGAAATYLQLRGQGLSNMAADGLARNIPVTGPHASEINAAAKKYGIPPSLLAALATQEWQGTPQNALGDFGHGHGYFQIDDRTWGAWLKTHHNGMNVGESAMLAASIIADEWKAHHDVRAVGGLYNAGDRNAAGTDDYRDRLVGTLNGVSKVAVPGGHLVVKAHFVQDHRGPHAGSRISNRPTQAWSGR